MNRDPSDEDAEARDPAVVWGRRVGRAIGYGLLALLVVNLFTRWLF
ncbi:MAG TPA: hypothetical protein VIL72_12580 [Beijerinckiaceae bacterium]|jgi:hypothetical protein